MTRYLLPLTPENKATAHAWVDRAVSQYQPGGAWTMEVRAVKRTDEQNRALWGALNQITRQRPVHNGVQMDAETWKALFLHALGHEVRWVPALDGNGGVPLGLRSSRLTKSEFADLLSLIVAWCDRNGVRLEHFEEMAA